MNAQFLLPPIYIKRIAYRQYPAYRHTLTAMIACLIALAFLGPLAVSNLWLYKTQQGREQMAKRDAAWAEEKLASLARTEKMRREVLLWSQRMSIKAAPVLATIEISIPQDISLTDLQWRLDPKPVTSGRSANLSITLYFAKGKEMASTLDSVWVSGFTKAMAAAGYRCEMDSITEPISRNEGYTRIINFKIARAI